MKGAVSPVFSLIPKEPHERALRLRRQCMALYSYLFMWGGILFAIELSIFEPAMPHLQIFSALFAVNAVIFFVIRSGLSEFFPDPSLTMLQMAIGIIFVTVILHYTREMRGAMMSIYYMILTFGLFSLDRRRLMIMAGFCVLCFISLQAYEWLVAPQTVIFSFVIGYPGILMLSMTWFIYMGGYIYNLQNRVKEQRAQLREAHERLTAIATRDELTGLYNRRHVIERLNEEVSLADRTGQPLHLALIDLDHFKAVNDNHGHPAGDDVLRRFARIAQEQLRKSDMIARYGGEEFIILFPHASAEACKAALERLNQRFNESRYDFSDAYAPTFSAGVAQLQNKENAEALTRRADAALYKAKAEGRNRVIVAE